MNDGDLEWLGPDSEPDYRLDIRVRNARFLKMCERRGYRSVAQVARESGVPLDRVYDIAQLKVPAYKKNGELRSYVEQLCDFFSCQPFDIFPARHLGEPLRRNRVTIELTAAETNAMLPSLTPAAVLLRKETVALLEKAVNELSPRSAYVIRRRFGFGEDAGTLEEIGHELGVNRERVRQIEKNALYRLRGKTSVLATAGGEKELATFVDEAEIER